MFGDVIKSLRVSHNISQVQLEKKSHDLLKLKGSAEDLLVYDLVWNGQP